MLLFFKAASCVYLNENNGGRNSLDVVLIICFMIVTGHDLGDFCWQSILPFIVFSVCSPLSSACL